MMISKNFLLSLLIVSLMAGIANAAIAPPSGSVFPNQPPSRPTIMIEIAPTFLLNNNDIKRLKAQPTRYASIITECKTNLGYQPRPIAVLHVKRHYTEAGQQAADPAAVQLAKDGFTAYQLGFCYQMTQEEAYAVAAQRILDAWASTFERVASHPAQGVINFNVPYLVIAANWVHSAAHWNSRRFDDFLLNRILPLAEIENNNNHGLWGVLLKGSIGAYLGDEQVINTAEARWQEILQGAVAADGTMPHELARSDTSNFTGGKTQGIKGIAYTHYAMLPATLAAKIFSDTGRDVWSTRGGKLLEKAFNRAAILTLYPETSPYYQSNQGRLVGVQNGSYFPLLLNYFPNQYAEKAVQLGYVRGDKFMLPRLF